MLNIQNNSKREVICVQSKKADEWFPNADKVKQGKLYHLEHLEVHNWHTDVYLSEFPQLRFNSLQFEEAL